MARDFNGSTQFGSMQVDFTTTACTFASWVRADSLGGSRGIIIYRSAVTLGLWTSSNVGFPLTYSWESTVDEFNAATGLTMSLGQWYLAAVAISATAAVVYLGQGATLSTHTNTKTHNSKSPNNANWRIGRDPTGAFWDGRIAETAIWTETLTVDEIRALSLGLSPRRVRPGSLRAYWPLWGLHSPELSLSPNNNQVTLTASPPQADHPPVRPYTRMERTMPEMSGEAFVSQALSATVLPGRNLIGRVLSG